MVQGQDHGCPEWHKGSKEDPYEGTEESQQCLVREGALRVRDSVTKPTGRDQMSLVLESSARKTEKNVGELSSIVEICS